MRKYRRFRSRNPSTHRRIIPIHAHDPNMVWLLSDTPDLAPWTDGVPAHKALEVMLEADGSIRSAYIPAR